jgi:hypothetical protein
MVGVVCDQVWGVGVGVGVGTWVGACVCGCVGVGVGAMWAWCASVGVCESVCADRACGCVGGRCVWVGEGSCRCVGVAGCLCGGDSGGGYFCAVRVCFPPSSCVCACVRVPVHVVPLCAYFCESL